MKKKNAGRLFWAALFLFLVLGSAGREYAGAEGWKFGDQLKGREKEIYEILEKNYSSVQSCNEVNGTTLKLASLMTSEEELKLQWNRMAQAFLLDHSELFWIDSLSIIKGEMNWNIATGVLTASSITVFTDDCYPGIRSEITAAKKELNKAIAAVKKSTGRYEKVKAAHDYVIRLITYPKNIMPAYYHSVTGPLLAKYAHKGVCEAYARLFDILCRENGIPCVTLEGSNHAWNYVQMEDGKWYLVDTTWDDPDSGSRISYDYFLVGADSTVRGKKVKKTHDADTVKAIYEMNNIAPLKYPALSGQAYKKDAKKVASIRITGSAKKVKAGRKLTLTATVLPAAAANKKLRWTSSNTKYATVTAKGVVKTKKAGKGKTVKITAKATDGSGKKATIQIKLK